MPRLGPGTTHRAPGAVAAVLEGCASVRGLVPRMLMRAWYLSREPALGMIPAPQDAPIARAPGPDQIRVLLLGNGAAAGWGVRSHDLALPGHLARQLSARLGRGVQVDARVDRTRRVRELPGLLADGVGRVDAVVLIAGMNDAVSLTALPRWRRAMADLLDRLRGDGTAPPVLVLGPQPVQSVSSYTSWPGIVAERHRRAMNRSTARLCAERGVHFAVLPAPSQPPGVPGHRSPAVYGEWAAWIAEVLAPLLQASVVDAERPQSEPERQRATESMLPDAPADAQLDRITDLARHVFGVEVAALSLIDGDLQKNRSVAGSDLARIPRTSSLCARTIQGEGALVIGDLQRDERSAGALALGDGSPVRFYAGYPIESPDGYRVGALCVLGSEPRELGDVDTGTLADLALLAQKQLWASVERADA